ncbi:hypothetical protein GCM10009555_107440 [Acrocarpospora macrocephala]|uniref:Uncharacterized protein n=1 Tax=Acrocarpospora macrocephala TaxID=150177 RepID=A0A5M3XBS6_9ACTN|nr:hypothetical protein Amac_105590 [Acrocarpospora macrocephala]
MLAVPPATSSQPPHRVTFRQSKTATSCATWFKHAAASLTFHDVAGPATSKSPAPANGYGDYTPNAVIELTGS